ncbi:MAG: metallophosphoesterase family protein [Gammaproteobacteria bacterium]
MQSGSQIDVTPEKDEKSSHQEAEINSTAPSESKVDFQKLTRPGYIYKIIPPQPKDEKERKSSRPFRMFTLGCADGAYDITAKVAELMERLAKGEEYDLILVLGDNMDGRVKTRDATLFLTHFHNIFAKHEKLKKIPKIVIHGNHDLLDHNGLNQDMLNAQIQHSYLKLTKNAETGDMEYVIDPETGNPALDMEKIALFTPKSDTDEEIIIPYEELQKSENQWIMASTHCAFDWGSEIEIICSNSSTFVAEALAQINGDKNPLNQAAWLSSIANKPTAPATKILASHHPIVTTIDKRIIKYASDHPDYISDTQYSTLVEMNLAKTENGEKEGEATSNHTEILKNLIFHPGDEALKIPKGFGDKITVFVSAHHHAIHLYHDGKQVQIVSGGMGGPPPLQNRWSFKNNEFVHAFVCDNGIVGFTIPREKDPNILFDIHCLNSPHLQFSLKDAKLLRQPLTEEAASLRQMVIEACTEYQNYLAEYPPQVHWQIPKQVKILSSVWFIGKYAKRFAGKVNDVVTDDVSYVDILKNYFNAVEPFEYQQSIVYLRAILTNLAKFPKWHQIFHNALMKHYEISYDDFITSSVSLTKKVMPVESKPEHPTPAMTSVVEPLDFSPNVMMPTLFKNKSLLSNSLLKSPKTPNKSPKKEPLQPLGAPSGRGLFTSVKAVLVGTPRKIPFGNFNRWRSTPVTIPAEKKNAMKFEAGSLPLFSSFVKNYPISPLAAQMQTATTTPMLIPNRNTLEPETTIVTAASSWPQPTEHMPLFMASVNDMQADQPSSPKDKPIVDEEPASPITPKSPDSFASLFSLRRASSSSSDDDLPVLDDEDLTREFLTP